MKKISNKHFSLNKINVSKLNTRNVYEILGGNTKNDTNQKTAAETCIETCGDTCTTSRYTVDFGSNATHC